MRDAVLTARSSKSISICLYYAAFYEVLVGGDIRAACPERSFF
ncbi:predicted protein [Plenodomus lingam JN3]|uniref:Predicted protein n=1 Tax=Leptosphaeria maculans (strain JN3 / isolate v23.1.3 / race Av1-4-5-6-7-8) TaxID=985895 RepID=E5A856_LEPMJ|nr:predicted protein [Plenodomus lingam JN3]CBX99801.1 predicted protein [Plenodomus lingam JN3]